MSERNSTFVALMVILAAISVGFNLYHWAKSSGERTGMERSAGELYTCPMHPQVVQDHPGDCPICGMKLVKKMTTAASDRKEDSLAGTVNLSPSQEVLAAIATEKVARTAFRPVIERPGRVLPVEGKRARVTVRAMGRVEKTYVDFTGANVKKGEPLCIFYSPEIGAAQREYFLTAATPQTTAPESLPNAAYKKLLALGMDERQIAEMKRRGAPSDSVILYAPIAGYVLEKAATPGEWVMPGMTLYELQDASEVWIEGALYEGDLHLVGIGDEMQVTVDAYPGEVYTGKVTWMAPVLDAATRTLPFRMTVADPKNHLKPDLFVRVQVGSRQSLEALSVPESAVLRLGTRDVVWVKVGEGRYRPREVVLGDEVEGRYAVLSGLEEGEEIVGVGSYLLDSDSRIRSTAGGAMPGMEMSAPPAASPGDSVKSEGTMKMSQASSTRTAPTAYICPMHPEISSDQPGRCPLCGMNLVSAED
jgi:Cu(I)/Ag(I) efflux system membrane fusion protein